MAPQYGQEPGPTSLLQPSHVVLFPKKCVALKTRPSQNRVVSWPRCHAQTSRHHSLNMSSRRITGPTVMITGHAISRTGKDHGFPRKRTDAFSRRRLCEFFLGLSVNLTNFNSATCVRLGSSTWLAYARRGVVRLAG